MTYTTALPDNAGARCTSHQQNEISSTMVVAKMSPFGSTKITPPFGSRFILSSEATYFLYHCTGIHQRYHR